MQGKRIAVISPHLDDAVLSCCDHIRAWRREGAHVEVVTVFTSYLGPAVSDFQRHYMDLAGIPSAEALERQRKDEDVRAMEMLGAAWRHLDFTDAAFRSEDGRLLYPDFASLCGGRPDPADAALADGLADAFAEFADRDAAVVCLGVGRQQDHVLARRAAERSVPPRKIALYVEFPYARDPRKWRAEHLGRLSRSRLSFRPMTRRKRRIMNCYASQIPYLFRWWIPYPEIVAGFPNAAPA